MKEATSPATALEPSQVPRPARRLLQQATAADPAVLQVFRPEACHYAVAGALFNAAEPLRDWKVLAVAAGITMKEVEAIVADPAACAWIINHSANIAKAGLALVYPRLLQKALFSDNPQWMSIFLKRFDPEFAKSDAPSGATFNTQINFQNYTDEELHAFVRQQLRLRLGVEPSRAS